MKTYRRIEVNAFRRRVTVVSGEWRPDICDAKLEPADDGVSLNDTDSCEPVTPDSPEGQVILVEAVRSLERRLSPETRAAMCAFPVTSAPQDSNRNRLYANLHSLYQRTRSRALRFALKENENVSHQRSKESRTTTARPGAGNDYSNNPCCPASALRGPATHD